MLGELAELGMVMARAIVRSVQASGQSGALEQKMLDDASRSVRRTLAMVQKIYAESLKSPELRHAESRCRIEAEARARFRLRRAAVVRAVEGEIRAHVTARGGDAERLLCDMHERLLDEDVERMSTKADFDAICLKICKDLSVTPRNQTWSDALMANETHLMLLEVREADASRRQREAASAIRAADPSPFDPLKTHDPPPDTG